MHSKQVILSVKNVKKYFVLPQFKKTSVKNAFVDIFRKNTKTRQKVLDGVSFDVYKGDFFGIVGRNGSGKSTLLKLIAGVYHPTTGSIDMRGGLTPFIELGVGFNPELSGRDNVYLNGALLGFTRKQMDKMYDEIVDFAELGPFMEQKLKNYSSGMQVRLAFSIAIKAKNDILIFDEVLAVGDEAFQRKCLDIFDEYKASGQTVILVTHDMDTVKRYCNRAILLSEGKIAHSGDPIDVADEYSRLNQSAIDRETEKKNRQSEEKDKSRVKVSIKNEKGLMANSYAVGEAISVEMEWSKEIKADRILLDLYKKSGEHVSNFISSREGLTSLIGKNAAKIQIELNVTPGSYYLAIGLWENDFKRRIASVKPAAQFTVTEDWTRTGHEFAGITKLNRKWFDAE